MNPKALVKGGQWRAWDQATLEERNISIQDLITEAATSMADWICSHVKASDFVIFCGSGHNGNDGRCLSRLLYKRGKSCTVVNVKIASDLQVANLLSEPGIPTLDWQEYIHLQPHPESILIDAVLGTGIEGSLSENIAAYIHWINKMPNYRISVDIPTGMSDHVMPAPGAEAPDCVRAHTTLCLGAWKQSFLYPESQEYIGNAVVLPIGLSDVYVRHAPSHDFVLDTAYMKSLCLPRPTFTSKHLAGHALILAGSYGKMGAAVLAAEACLRSGAGLLTVACPKAGYELMQSSVPECMVHVVEEHEKYVSSFPTLRRFQALGIGPGLGKRPITKMLLKNLLMTELQSPMVLDADALNLLAELWQEQPDLNWRTPTILTPHVKEFQRLTGSPDHWPTMEQELRKLASSRSCIVILKGAFTRIALPDGSMYFNTTGNAGMAKGGSGDVLTGLITGLLSRGYLPREASLLGVFLHGRAGDLAAQDLGMESMTSRDVVKYLAKATKELYDQ